MSVSSMKNKVKRLEELSGRDAFSIFLRKYLKILDHHFPLLPCEDEKMKVDDSEFKQLRLDYPEEAQKFDEWVDKLEQAS